MIKDVLYIFVIIFAICAIAGFSVFYQKNTEIICKRVIDLNPKHPYDELREIPVYSGQYYWCGK